MLSSQMLSALLGNANLRKLFIAIADRNRLQGSELVDIGVPASMENTYAYLEQLQQGGLIQVDASLPIEDFRTYYITADGLEMARELRRIEAVSSTDMRAMR